ncbi:MAG: DUF1326 domain-containing protein [Gammaproteobacteria bacterium]
MNRREFAAVLGLATTAPTILTRAHAAAAWALEADIAECCSCAIPCPCNFGRPTDKQCLGNRLVRITGGQVGGADLAGIAFLATFDMGNWVRIQLDDSLDEARSAAFEAIFPLAFQGFHKLTVARERVPLTVRGGDGVLGWSTPSSAVEMKRLAGLDGQPITIANLPSPAFYDYTQYESVVHRHDSASGSFAFSGTNGFTSRMVVSAA